MTTRSAIAAALATAALLAPAAAGAADTYHGPGYSITVQPSPAPRVHVYEYAPRVHVYEYAPPEPTVYYVVPRRPPLYDPRELSPYDADRYFGHPGATSGVASPRDSNPTDHSTGIYNPRR